MNILFISKHHQSKPYYHHSIFFFILLLLPFFYVNAQNSNSDSDSDSDSSPFYTTGVVLTGLAVLSFLAYLVLYTFFKRFVLPWAAQNHHNRVHTGIDPLILRSFPVFMYPDVTGFKPIQGPAECAICLGLFEKDETLRLLPKCSHVFHVGCVDPWLADHTTCPLCRGNLVSEPGELTQMESSCVAELGCQEGEVNVAQNEEVEVNEVVNDVVEVGREMVGVQHGKVWRWNSTGHVARGEGMEYDEKSMVVRKENESMQLRRSKSCIIIRVELG